MGILRDILWSSEIEGFEKELKDAYGMGFRDGRLRPAELRPCEVDGRACLFHRFGDEDQALLRVNVFCRDDEARYLRRRMDAEGYVAPGCSTEVIRRTYALVEFPDGSLGKVDPKLVRFTDREEVEE